MVIRHGGLTAAERVKKAVEVCKQECSPYCPYWTEDECHKHMMEDYAEAIAERDERIAIMQESMETMEKRCNALEALEQRCKALEVLEKREQVCWINMDEDEPPMGQKVLVYRAQKPVEIMSMLYQDNEYWWRNDVDEICKVYDNDYWMLLPQPPKGCEVG